MTAKGGTIHRLRRHHTPLLMICDGVSSSPLGGWAARTCTAQMDYMFSKRNRLSFEEFQECLLDIDFELRGKGRGKAACTISAIYIDQQSAWLASLGDSPVFCISQNTIRRLIDNDETTGLRTFLGMGRGLLLGLTYQVLDLHSEDWLLLMSDGVAEALSEQVMQDFFPKRNQPDIAQEICKMATKYDGYDDLSLISAVLV